MEIGPFSSSVVIILTVGFLLASILGYLSLKAGLSSIPGYLLAGYLIGPYSPGFVADLKIAEQLAEIGVILMMFNVGLHINILELLLVKQMAIPGAIFQILVSGTAGTLLIYALGWPFAGGVSFGIAISVASTMILVKMITDYKLLKTQEGHLSIGWLIVEDLITVLFLILIPILASFNTEGKIALGEVSYSIGIAFLYFVLLIGLLMSIGKKSVAWILEKTIKTHSNELFTLTVLALTFLIAIGSAHLFGTSIALGAFMAGVVMGQTHRDSISKTSEGLKDIFTVLFFLAIGMLFNPLAILDNFTLFAGTLFIVLLLKPFAAFFIIYVMKYPLKTAALVAIALAQIGEFSFIVAEEAARVRLLPDEGYDIIVAVSLISIALNPILFKLYSKINFHQKENQI